MHLVLVPEERRPLEKRIGWLTPITTRGRENRSRKHIHFMPVFLVGACYRRASSEAGTLFGHEKGHYRLDSVGLHSVGHRNKRGRTGGPAELARGGNISAVGEARRERRRRAERAGSADLRSSNVAWRTASQGGGTQGRGAIGGPGKLFRCSLWRETQCARAVGQGRTKLGA